MALRLAWLSDPGIHRQNNEDYIAVRTGLKSLDAVIVIADGMGGHASGQVASKLVAETIVDEVAALDKLDGERLHDVLAKANTAVYEVSQSSAEHTGMGSTVVLVAIQNGHATTLNVGDSPAYLIRSGEISDIYQNHSWPAEQARAGIITADQVAGHPMKHRLARAVGVWDQVKAYMTEVDLQLGDLIVLCSDGVEGAGVSIDEIRESLDQEDLQVAVEQLIALCVDRGAPDNVSVAVARVE